MSNKVNVDMSLNATAYQQGMQEAIDSTKAYETETKRVKDNLGNFRKEFSLAKKEVQNLALAYKNLTAEEKKSQFGKEMARQLDEAKQKAAEMTDLMGDVQAELKNMASDTRFLDTMTEGMGILADTTAGALGVIAQFTGNEKDAQNAIVAFTTAQSVLSGVTKIQNALQMQSNTMLAVTKAQNLAAAAAERIKTAATNQGTIATRGATVAQWALNKAAYANPYVLLAMAIAAVVAALASFVIFSHKAADAEEAEAKATERNKAIKDAYYNTYNEQLSTTMGNYSKLQNEWKNLKSEGEKTDWIKKNEDGFHDLGYEITNTSDAEKFFVDNEATVIKSFVARAEAAALAAQQVEIFNQALKDMPQVGDKMSGEWMEQNGLSTKGHKRSGTFYYDYEFTEEDRQKLIKKRLDTARESAEKLAKLQLEAEKKANKTAADVGVKTYEKERNKKLKDTKTKTTTKVEIKVEEGSLTEAENKLKTLEELRTKMSIDNPDLPKIQAEIEKVKKDISDKKIKLGLELPKTDLDTMSEYEKSLKKAVEDAKAAYMVEWMQNPNSEKLLELWDNWDKATEKVNNYEEAVKRTFEGVTVTKNKDVENAFNADPKTIEEYQKAISALESYLNSADWSTMGQTDELGRTTKTFDEYISRIQELKAELGPLENQLSDAMITPLEKTQNTISDVAQAFNDLGSIMGSLGSIFNDKVLNATAIIAQAVATYILGWTEATAKAAKLGPIGWAAFGLSTAAQALAVVEQIKSAGKYAQGGIVGGSSYSGDRLIANVNSGEMILNSRQQRNLFNAIDQNKLDDAGKIIVIGETRIKGSDLAIIYKNYAKGQKLINKNIF